MRKLKLVLNSPAAGKPKLSDVHFRLSQLEARIACASYLLDSEVISGTVENNDELIVMAAMVIKEATADLRDLNCDLDRALVGVANG